MFDEVTKSGFRLPAMHHTVYTTRDFSVANWYAHCGGSFHAACGAEFGMKTKDASPGKVFLCLGLDPQVGPAYLRYSKAEHLLPCCVVDSLDRAAAAEAHLQMVCTALLVMLPFGNVLGCFQAWLGNLMNKDIAGEQCK